VGRETVAHEHPVPRLASSCRGACSGRPKSGRPKRRETIERFDHVLRAGKPLLVFPEGTRSRDGALRTFKMGAFHAAVRAGVPVVRVAIGGTRRLMKRGAFDTDEGRARVRIGVPIRARHGVEEGEAATQLCDETRAAILRLLEADAGQGSVAPVT